MAAGRYRLAVSTLVKEQLEDALHTARQVGLRKEAIRAARWISKSWNEPHLNLASLANSWRH